MNTINGSGMHVPTRELVVGGAQPKQAAGLTHFGECVQEASSPPSMSEGCSGTVNQVDLEAFFAAWGTDDAMYDIDNSGVVDGSDLAIFLSGPSSPMAGSIEDIHAQWGFEGKSTADLNADHVVDGQDLAIALGEAGVASSSEETLPFAGNKLEALLADWGTESTRSDYNNDGIVNGLDLSLLLGGGARSGTDASSASTSVPTLVSALPVQAPYAVESESLMHFDPVKSRTNSFAKHIHHQLGNMGFGKYPPQNLIELVDAFNFPPMESKTMLSKIIDLFGGQDGGLVARG